MSSSSKVGSRFKFPGLLVLMAALSIGGYVVFSAITYRVGFPLDDAWIHQTYARNLALRGEWAFIPDQPSAGSTSPLWSALLAPGCWVGLAPYVWTYLLGWIALVGVGLAGWRIIHVFHPGKPWLAMATGLFLILEWHLVWAAASGMETLLFALLALVVLGCLAAGFKKWWAYGLLVGVSVWLRPDGITLAGPVLLLIFLVEKDWKNRLTGAFSFVMCVLAMVLPYLFFNLALSGAWWPNTYFAKQAEYAIYRQLPLWQRFIQQAGLLLVGPGALVIARFSFDDCACVAAQELGGFGWRDLADRLPADLCATVAGYIPIWAVCDAGDAGLFSLVSGRYGVLGQAGRAKTVEADIRAGMGGGWWAGITRFLGNWRKRLRSECSDHRNRNGRFGALDHAKHPTRGTDRGA